MKADRPSTRFQVLKHSNRYLQQHGNTSSEKITLNKT
ncbi:hypothetical protein Nmel_000990 [Mimus melanotis]